MIIHIYSIHNSGFSKPKYFIIHFLFNTIIHFLNLILLFIIQFPPTNLNWQSFLKQERSRKKPEKVENKKQHFLAHDEKINDWLATGKAKFNVQIMKVFIVINPGPNGVSWSQLFEWFG